MKRIASVNFCSALCLLLAMITAVAANTQEAPGTVCPPEVEPLFSATVNGQSVEMHSSRVGSFGIFPVKERAEVKVHAGFDVRWVEVRPLSAKVQARIAPNRRDVTFTVTDTTPLTIEFNDDLVYVVHLFPHSPEVNPPKGPAPNLRYFGPGKHDAGLIELKSGQSIYLAPGAWVRGAIHARNAEDIAIFGHGVLDASGVTELTPPYSSNTPMYFEKTKNLRIEGITVFNSHGWTVHLSQANGTVIDGLKILNPGTWMGDDGIDVNSSSHVLIQNVFIRTNDDCVAVKNFADVPTADINVRHSVLWNMPNGGNGLEIGFETRNQPTRDVRFEDIDLIHVERGSAISIHNGDSAIVENISFENIRVEDVRRKLIDLAVLYAQYGPDKPRTEAEIHDRMDRGGSWDAILCYLPSEKNTLFSRRGHIRNISIKNMHVVSGALPYSVISGFDGAHLVEGVTIEGLTYQGRPLRDAASAKLVQEHASGVSIR